MRARLPLLLLSLVLAAAGARAASPEPPADPAGDYVVVAVREPSGATHGAPRPGLPLNGKPVRIGGAGVWIDGNACKGLVQPAATPWPYGADSSLSDLNLAATPDHRLNRSFALDCGWRSDAGPLPILQVDGRVLVAAIENGARFAVLEKPLPRGEALEVERALARAGFDPGAVDGVVDAATRRAAGAYARAKGAAFAFDPGVFTENLLTQLLAGGGGNP
jgi:hypothetical protein